jgi:tripartite-type tricarboxylate transporter receptor subunit TctC
VDKLNRAVNEVLAEKNIDARLVEEGADPAAGTPERFAEFVRREYEKWRVIVQQSGATVD